MRHRFRVSMRTLLATTALVAVWFGMVVASAADWMQSNPITGETPVFAIPVAIVMMTLPAAAVGTLFGRPGLGFLCGAVTVAAWFLRLAYHYSVAA